MTDAERNLLRIIAVITGVLLGHAAGTIPTCRVRKQAADLERELLDAMRELQ